MQADKLRDQLVEAIEAENDELRERIAFLEELVGLRMEVPPVFSLSQHEDRLLGVLLKREFATKEHILHALYGHRPNEVPEIKIIDVFVCKARAKLKKFDIEIDTLWGKGYALNPANKAKIRQYLQPEAIAS